jgi:iron complex outermembrane receptor protein
LISFVAEHQWHVNDQWTTFLSGRADKHTFTDWMFSPRAAVAYSPTQKDTIKLIGSQSVRTNFEEEMKIRHDASGDKSDPETAETVELRYERQQNVNTLLAASVFYNYIDALGWDDNAGAYSGLGTYQTIGAEVEANYRTGDTRVTFSHGIVKLLDIDFDDGVRGLISAKTVGYGDDLANWPAQITKLTAHHQISRHLSADASLRIEWGFPGDKDFLRFYNDNPPNGPGTPTAAVSNWNEPYTPNYFLNLGAEYRFDEHAVVRLDAYNVLGWIDHAFNKRQFLGGDFEGEYRADAAALGLTFKYQF